MNKKFKNYVGFSDDHSGSMHLLAAAAIRDSNATTSAIKDAATREMLDTIVYRNQFGSSVTREIVNSNPHVLKPATTWPTNGMTALYDAIGDMITQLEAVPDYNNPDVSFLVMATTDGDENVSHRWTARSLAEKITELQAGERWTFVLRVPKGHAFRVANLGVPAGNIQEWETTAKGMEISTAATTAAVNTFYATRSAGKKGSSVFYADASAIDAKTLAASLKDISGEVTLYVVPAGDNGIEIRPFILRHRMEYLKGSAFYQLTKTEARVSHTKLIVIRDRVSGKMYSGLEARKLIGLPVDANARLHPGDHGNYDLFIQSESVNRKLVGGTGLLYWKAIGVPFKPEDTAYLQPKPAVPVAPAVVQLPAVAPTNKPTPSPIPVTKRTHLPDVPQPIVPADGGRVRYYEPCAGAVFYPTRDDARYFAAMKFKKAYDGGPTRANPNRHFVA